MNSFSFHQQLTAKEYRRLTYIMLYRKGWFIVLNILSLLFLISLPHIYKTSRVDIIDNVLFQWGTIVTILALYVLITGYFSANRVFKGNYRLSEKITYILSEEGIESKGESFSGQYTWDKVYRVKILKKWLLIYQTRSSANLIKIDEKDHDNIESLKAFLNTKNFRLKKNW
jgi:hypothetical protein